MTRLLVLATVSLSAGLSACAPGGAASAAAPPRTPREGVALVATDREPRPQGTVEVGYATWYGGDFNGRKTANGERFDPMAMTAAHRTLPFGTWVEVVRRDTGRSVRVRITDRGPFHRGRIIDLSKGAAQQLDMLKVGVAEVELRPIP